MTNVSAQIAQAYGSYFWPKSDGPHYIMGFSASAAFSFMCIVLCWVMRFWLKRDNKRMRQANEAGEGDINTYAY
jgi:hypothetical protein